MSWKVYLSQPKLKVQLIPIKLQVRMGERDLVFYQYPNRLEVDFDYQDAALGSLEIGLITAGKRVSNTVLIITTPFDSLRLTIGDDDAQARLMTIAENDTTKSQTYSVESYVEYDETTTLKMFFLDTPSVGNGTVIVYFS